MPYTVLKAVLTFPGFNIFNTQVLFLIKFYFKPHIEKNAFKSRLERFQIDAVIYW